MNRRALFGFLSVSPVAIVGAAAAASVAKADAPPGGPLLTLTPTKRPTATPIDQAGVRDGWARISGFATYERDDSRCLELNIGADGNLWVRPNGKPWQRVLTG